MRRGFEGYMQFNDVPYADRVEIFSSGFGLHFSPADKLGLFKRSVGVHPMPASALVQDSEMMRSGFYYSMQGTYVGGCSEGPLGHPGDGEFYVRRVLEFTIAAKYTYDFLTLGLSGRTGEGEEVHRGAAVKLPAGRRLEPWTFRIELRIPREAIAEALRLPDPEKYSLYERLELCRDAA
jgi:hypothetical protein